MSYSSSDDLLPTFWNPGIGKYHQAVRIPVTTQTRYLSYSVALSLRLPGEDTGEGGGDAPFVTPVGSPRTLTPAGPGGWSDTTPSLGSMGVRDMAHVIEGLYIPPGCGPVWVANHYRAIADYVLVDTQGCWCAKFPRHLPVYSINRLLFAPEQVEHLVEEYLKPLRNQLSPEERELHDAWLPTVVFG